MSIKAPSYSWWSAALAGLGVFMVVTALKLAIPAIGGPTPFLAYQLVVIVTAWRGGVVAGLGATVVCAAGGLSWILTDLPGTPWPDFVTQLVVFVLEGGVLSGLAARAARDHARSIASEQAAREAAAERTAVLDAIEIGVTMQDAKGRLIYANMAAANITGFASPREFLSTPIPVMMERFEVLDAEDRPLPLDRLPNRVLMSGGQPQELIVGFRTRGDDSTRYSQVNAHGIRDTDGSLRFVVNTFLDVTDKRRQEEALRVSQEWFSIALRSIGDAVIATDPEGWIMFMNPVAETLTGWSTAEAAGRPLVEVFVILNEETRQTVESPVDKVIREGTVVGLANHTILVRKDGTELAIDDSAAPIRGSSGALEGVVLVFRDVTAARHESAKAEFLARATEALSSSLDYQTTLATVAELAVPRIADWCAVDMVEDGEIRRLAVAHVDPAKVRFVEEIQRRYPRDLDAQSGVPQVLRTGQAEWVAHIPPELIEAAAQDEEHLGLIRELELRSYIAVPLACDGRPCGVITLAMAESRRTYSAEDLVFATALADRAAIAVQKARLFREVERARAEAVHASRAKDDFLAMLGHELRNPLAPILSALDMMKARPTEPATRAREIIERQVRGMMRLVDDLLDVSRVVHGRIVLSEEWVDVASVIDKGLEVAAPLIEQRKHHLDVDVPPGLVVWADAQRLVQVMSNLLMNAAKYTDSGGRITVRVHEEDDEMVVRVRDTGVGIAPEMLPRVFEVFTQHSQDLDRAQGGLGLGLAIARGLVELHGGRIGVLSEGPGQGSEFIVRLPAARTGPATTGEPEAPPKAALPSEVLRVLLVDDNEDALMMMAMVLEHLGCETFTASDPKSALSLAPTVRPAIALLDIGLPQIDGYELGRRLRAMPELRTMKLVALTGYGQASDIARSAAAGFEAHVVKPVGIDTLRGILEDVHMRRRSAEE